MPGETRSVACNAGFTSWPCIAVSQGSAHFPINLLQKKIGFSRVFEVFDEFHLLSPKSLKCLQVSKFAKLMEEFKDSFIDFN